jgi:hypothetical protein
MTESCGVLVTNCQLAVKPRDMAWDPCGEDSDRRFSHAHGRDWVYFPPARYRR